MQLQSLAHAQSTPYLPLVATDPRHTASMPDLRAADIDTLIQVAAEPKAKSSRQCVSAKMFKGLMYSAFAGVAAGVSTPLIYLSSQGIGPFASACLMQAGAGIVVCGATYWVPQSGAPLWPLKAKTVALLGTTAVMGCAVAPVTLSWALKHTSAASVSLTMNIEPFAAALAAWPIFHDRPSKHMAVAGLCAIVSGVLCTVGQLREQPTSGAGVGVAVACSVSWACWDLALYALRDKRPMDVVGVSFVTGTAICGAAGGIFKDTFPKGAGIAKLLGCGALGFAGTDTLLSLAMREIGVGRASLMFTVVGLVVGTSMACAMKQGKFTALIGASLGVALLGAAVLAHERFSGANPAAPVAALAAPERQDIELGLIRPPTRDTDDA